MESVVIHPALWQGRRVFLTGHTGFKGAWATCLLRRLGAEVHGYALAPEAESLFNAARLADDIDHTIADIRDPDALATALDRARPSVVIHMAAQALVRRSYADPVETYATNVMGTVHLLEAVRACPSAEAVVIVTSDKCYANNGWLWGYRENDALGGHDPYSSSKACAELVTDAYRRSFFSAAGAAARRVRPRRQRDRRRRLGGGPHRPRCHPRLQARVCRCRCAIPPPPAPGSMCSIRCSAI